MSEKKFPTEIIDLPSKGKFYDENSPLRSGQIELKYMTAKEEDIITSTNLIQKKVVLDKLFESLIVTPGVKPHDLLMGDLNAVMIATRILGYGKDYPVTVACPSCGSSQESVCDLTELEEVAPTNELPFENGLFTIKLPVSGHEIKFMLLTRKREKEMQDEIDGYKKFDKNIDRDATTFFKFIIKSVNDNTDKAFINDFAENILVRDARALRETYKNANPNVKLEFKMECSVCGAQNSVRLPIGIDFFWPDARL